LIVEGLKRGMRLIVVDPRRAGLANKADIWLRVRPGTDGALALGIANMISATGTTASFSASAATGHCSCVPTPGACSRNPTWKRGLTRIHDT
jgi:formylmethanofuran dehydrogenase subunit B